jgi:MFS family permease
MTPDPDAAPPVADAPGSPDPVVAGSPKKSAMLVVFLVVFVDLLGFGIVLPLLPRYVDQYFSPDTPKLQVGIVIGLLYCAFSGMQFLCSPVWGRLSDRIGRKPVLLIGLLASVVFYALFGFASSLPAEQATLALTLLFVSRIGAGIAGATISTAAAVIADCTTKENRARGMALIGAAFGIGFTFGPLIAYVGLELYESARWAPGAMAAALSAVALLLGVLLFHETRKPDAGGETHRRSAFDFGRWYETLQTPTVGTLVFIYFLAVFGFANFEGTLSLFTDRAFGLNDRDNFLVFAFVGFTLMVAQGGLYRPLAKRYDEIAMLRAGVVLMFLGLAGLAAVAYWTGMERSAPKAALGWAKPVFYVSLAVAVTGFAFTNPSLSALVSKRSDPARQGEVLGVNQSFSALARILGPFAGNVLFQLDDTGIAPYLAAAGLLLWVVVLIPRVR